MFCSGKIFEFNFNDQNLRQIFQAEDIQTIQEVGLLSIAINKQYDEFVIGMSILIFNLLLINIDLKKILQTNILRSDISTIN